MPAARIAAPGERVHHLRDQRLALAHRDQVREGRQRLRVQEDGGPAQDDHGIAGPAVRGPQRDAGQAQHAQDVDVVVLEGDRERHHVEAGAGESRVSTVARGCPVRSSSSASTSSGRKARSQRTSGVRVQHLVDAVEAEVRHPDVVEVRVAERDAEGPLGRDGRERHLGLEVLPVSLLERACHVGPARGARVDQYTAKTPGKRGLCPGRGYDGPWSSARRATRPGARGAPRDPAPRARQGGAPGPRRRRHRPVRAGLPLHACGRPRTS